jgi:hypothetical protein
MWPSRLVCCKVAFAYNGDHQSNKMREGRKKDDVRL